MFSRGNKQERERESRNGKVSMFNESKKKERKGK